MRNSWSAACALLVFARAAHSQEISPAAPLPARNDVAGAAGSSPAAPAPNPASAEVAGHEPELDSTKTPARASAPNPAGALDSTQAASTTIRAADDADPQILARVRISLDRPSAWLETRAFGEYNGWQRVCSVPCGGLLRVDGMELRVVAEGMTPSAAFRVQPGAGSALVRVHAGSARSRWLGTIALVAGLPLTLAGAAAFGAGSLDDRASLKIAGGATLGVGAALLLVSFPLLVLGGTSVRDEAGNLVASRPSGARF